VPSKLNVIIGCEESGVIRDAFARLGHNAWSCDLKPTKIPGQHHKGDIFEFLESKEWDLGIFHPPCRYLAVTGNKWLYHPGDTKLRWQDRRPHPNHPNRWELRKEAAVFFLRLARWEMKMKCTENPVCIMSSLWKQPSQIICPTDYGHKEPKKTCLWLEGLPLLLPTKKVEPEYHKTKSGKNVPKWIFFADRSGGDEKRREIRSGTFQGVADAMADQWTRYEPVHQFEIFK